MIYCRGHGTYIHEGHVVSNIPGAVNLVNRLITVQPLHSRYSGQVGDIIVGRIEEVLGKSWNVDVGGRQHAVLLLSSINLSDGAQRRRNFEDQLRMRSFYKEGDLISAEVHSIHEDGVISLHARNLKYGKLENGQFIKVQSSLVRRAKNHFISLPCGVDIILGLNGYIWMTETAENSVHNLHLSVAGRGVFLEGVDTSAEAAKAGISEAIQAQKEIAASRDISEEARLRIARVRNCIQAIASTGQNVTADSIMSVYRASVEQQLRPAEILLPKNMLILTKSLEKKIDK